MSTNQQINNRYHKFSPKHDFAIEATVKTLHEFAKSVENEVNKEINESSKKPKKVSKKQP